MGKQNKRSGNKDLESKITPNKYYKSNRRKNRRGKNNRRFDHNLTDRNSTKIERQDAEIGGTVAAMSTDNPFSPWYNKYAQFTRDAGSIAFANGLGVPISMPNGWTVVNPGIMRLKFTPTIGYSKDLQSPINLSATKFQNYLRSVQKAGSDYDAADTMMYLMAVDSLYLFHSMMKRVYRTAQLYTPMNKYYPRVLLVSQGVHPSIAQDLARFRAYINKFAISLSSFPIPNGFDITSRHEWMAEGLYLDSESSRAQTYIFVPALFWKYNNTVTTGSQLEPIFWLEQDNTQVMHTLDEIINTGETLINAIINDQDVTNIAGDILRAYGPSNCKQVTELTDMEAVIPVYSKEVLTQIENCTIVGEFATSYLPRITQDPSVNNGAIIFTPSFQSGRKTVGSYIFPTMAFCTPNVLLNFHWDSPSPEDVIEATRLTACIASSGETNLTTGVVSPSVFGADVINSVAIYVLRDNGSTIGRINAWTNMVAVLKADDGKAVTLSELEYAALAEGFDWSPMFYLVSADGATTATDLEYVFADVDNMANVPAYQLNNMHLASMFSLFEIPQIPSRS